MNNNNDIEQRLLPPREGETGTTINPNAEDLSRATATATDARSGTRGTATGSEYISSSAATPAPATRSLLGNSHFYGNATSSTSVRRTLVKWSIRVCSLTTLIVAVVLVFAAASGMFKSMDKSPPEITGNSTVIEPNTRFEYPVVIGRHVGGVNPQKIAGLCVWLYSIPIPTHPHVEVATVGLYVDAAEGRRRLLKFKNMDAKALETPKVLDEIEHELRRVRPLTLRYKMVGNPASHSKQVRVFFSFLCTLSRGVSEGLTMSELRNERCSRDGLRIWRRLGVAWLGRRTIIRA